MDHDHLPTGKETAEGTSDSNRPCENGQSCSTFRWLIPVTKIHDDAREVSNASCLSIGSGHSPRKEASFCDPQEEPNGKQALEVEDGRGADRNDTPRNHDATDPDRG